MNAVVLVHEKEGKQILYWLMIPPSVACLSTRSEFQPDGAIKKLVIEEDLAVPYPIFTVEKVRERVMVVNLLWQKVFCEGIFMALDYRKLRQEEDGTISKQRILDLQRKERLD